MAFIHLTKYFNMSAHIASSIIRNPLWGEIHHAWSESSYLKNRTDSHNVVRMGVTHVGSNILPGNADTFFWNVNFIRS